MSDNLITRTGRALYGRDWQSALSRDVGVADRTVRRWAAGEVEPRPGVYVDLMRLTVERQAELDDVIEELKRYEMQG